MNTRNNIGLTLVMVFLASGFTSFETRRPPFPDLIINLDYPQFLNLRLDGGVKQLDDTGIRGIIIYRVSETNYLAYERNCTYHPAEDCATVKVDQSGLFMVDPCCGSTFSLSDGFPTGGPAAYQLIQYRTTLKGRTLTVVDEIIN